jgi:hypothetical protein
VSAAAVSGAVRYLVHMGLLAREPDPGSRRDRYRLPDNVWYEASVIKGGLLKSVADLADSGVDALGGTATPSGARIAEMRDFFLFIQVELDDMVAKWRASKAATQDVLPPTLAFGPDQ